MVKYLKGNYPIRRKKGVSSAKTSRQRVLNTTEEFERRALEKLGGSIAFVVKSSFVWDGESGDDSR